MTIREPNWDFTLRNQSHLGKNGILGTGWLGRTARECVESYQRVQLPWRGPPREIAHPAWQGSGTRRKGWLQQTELCESWSRTGTRRFHEQQSHKKETLQRPSVSEKKRDWRPQAKTTAISVSYKCPLQARPPWLSHDGRCRAPWGLSQTLLHHSSCF